MERKFQNYSYVLNRMGHPYVPGLKPHANIQRHMMPAMIEQFIVDHDPFSQIEYPEAGPSPDAYLDKQWAEVYDRAPPPMDPLEETFPFDARRVFKVDFAARDARNRSLGVAGERFVIALQRRSLQADERHDLAHQVEHVAERDDGAGFDIRSFHPDGRERLIEVKTTPYPATTPFYLSENELRCSRDNETYELHRVYHWGRGPRVFILPPPLEARVHLEPSQYRARF